MKERLTHLRDRLIGTPKAREELTQALRNAPTADNGKDARNWAQPHAEKCRALPKPER